MLSGLDYLFGVVGRGALAVAFDDFDAPRFAREFSGL
jgi:hypothetical protein